MIDHTVFSEFFEQKSGTLVMVAKRFSIIIQL